MVGVKTTTISGVSELDIQWMRHALNLALRAQVRGEVPVGAVLVKQATKISEGWNQSIALNDPTAHAEIAAIRNAAQALENYRIPGTTLYVTLEPCVMCVGALIHARVRRLVFGAYDPKSGAAGSVFPLLQSEKHNHKIEISAGILAADCAAVLKEFFRNRRKPRNKDPNCSKRV